MIAAEHTWNTQLTWCLVTGRLDTGTSMRHTRNLARSQYAAGWRLASWHTGHLRTHPKKLAHLYKIIATELISEFIIFHSFQYATYSIQVILTFHLVSYSQLIHLVSCLTMLKQTNWINWIWITITTQITFPRLLIRRKKRGMLSCDVLGFVFFAMFTFTCGIIYWFTRMWCFGGVSIAKIPPHEALWLLMDLAFDL